jgi:hypothetical protein
MTIAHLRPTPLGEPNELVRCSSLTLLPNELHLEIGPNLEDRSVYLEPYGAASQRMYRQLHGAAINVGRPIRRNQNPYWRTIRYVAAEGRLGLTSLTRDGSSPFDTIFYLEELTVPADPPTDESGEGAPAESTQAGADGALEPAEGDDDATLYSKMIGRMLAQLPEARYSRDILSLIGDLRLEEALPFLTVRWEESPEDLDLARTLLLLGDTSGQQRLLTAVEEEDRFALQILVSLVDSGVVEALEPAIEWLTGGGPPRGSSPRPYARTSPRSAGSASSSSCSRTARCRTRRSAAFATGPGSIMATSGPSRSPTPRSVSRPRRSASSSGATGGASSSRPPPEASFPPAGAPRPRTSL